jgi:peptidoglycan/LPS O-acetylase OafA/YrhL
MLPGFRGSPGFAQPRQDRANLYARASVELFVRRPEPWVRPRSCEMRRIPELDGLRGLAALAVVLYHAEPDLVPYGWAGVDLFFVLSGYLITTVIFERLGDETFLRDFYRRRAVRIWPVYYLTLAAVLVVNLLSTRGYSTAGLLHHLVFLQNTPYYWGRTPPPFPESFAHSWSVAVEEQFYLVWPVLLLLWGRRAAPVLAMLLLLACTVGGVIWPQTALLLTRGQGLALGWALAWALHGRPSVPAGGGRAAGFILSGAAVAGAGYAVVYAILFPGSPYLELPALTLPALALLFAGIVGGCVRHTGSRRTALLRAAPLTWLGTISYALYMFHLPIINYAPEILTRVGVDSSAVRAAVLCTLVIALPAASWYGMERPLLQRHRARTAPVSGLACS